MDISAPSPISAQATLAAQAPVREPPSVATVDPSPATDSARMDANTANGESGNDTAADARQRLAHRERLEDPKTPTGPPPTFQVTLLEVEQDLQNILARLEVARSQDRDAEAVRPEDRAHPTLTMDTTQVSAEHTADIPPDTQLQPPDADKPAVVPPPPVPENSATAIQTDQQAGSPQNAPPHDGMPV